MLKYLDLNSKNFQNYCNDESYVDFCNRIKNYPVLSKAEERILFSIMKGNDKENSEKARTKLIQSNQRFIIAVAKIFSNNFNIMDLISEGNMGLIEAMDSFDLSRDVKFVFYAVHYIRRNMMDFLLANGTISNHMMPRIYAKRKECARKFQQENERMPSDEELLELVDDNRVNKDSIKDFRIASIDGSIFDDNMGNCDVVSQFNSVTSSSNDYNRKIAMDDASIKAEAIINMCHNEREKTILKMFYGIGYSRSFNFSEIAEEIKLSRERVRQIHKALIERFRRMSRVKSACHIC